MTILNGLSYQKKCDTNINSVINKISIGHILWLILSLKKDKHFTSPKWSSRKQPESLEYLSLHCFFDRIYMYSFRICCLFCTEWTGNSIDQTKLVRLSVSCYLQLLNMHGTKATGSSLRVFFRPGATDL